MGVVVYLGNHQTIDKIHVTDSEGQPVLDETGAHWKYDVVDVPGKNRMEYAPPDDWTRAEIVADLTKLVWPWHSVADKPAWVASTDSALAALLGGVFDCPVREVDLDHQQTEG